MRTHLYSSSSLVARHAPVSWFVRPSRCRSRKCYPCKALGACGLGWCSPGPLESGRCIIMHFLSTVHVSGTHQERGFTSLGFHSGSWVGKALLARYEG